MIKKAVFILVVFLHTIVVAQDAKPKLVVGIVVDQMRYDYISRFWDKFDEGGFKKLVKEGYSCSNTNFNYMPTYTGPGHASIYTGTTPENHGIIANNWYNKQLDSYLYCTEDTNVKSVGSTSAAGEMSPKNMLGTTITDELKLATNFKGKVIGISLKDRGAILPAGHKADAAYWFEGGNVGKWISSTYYMNELPLWVQTINKNNTANKYLSSKWETLLPIKKYTESIADNNRYEGKFEGETAPVFPHDLPALRDGNGNYSLIKGTPFGNTITKEMALAAIKSEKLGQDKLTDFLAISFSSTDYVGHQYGPMSVEIEDTYLRLDKDLIELFTYLSENFEKDEVLIFLTADHGAVNVPQYLMDNNLPAGYFDLNTMKSELQSFVKQEFGVDSIIKNLSNYNVFLNHEVIKNNKLHSHKVEKSIAEFVMKFEGVAKSVTSSALRSTEFNDRILSSVQRGYNQKRSGDVIIVLESGWITAGYETGTTHGSPYAYDTHVPLLWYGYRVKKGETNKPVFISDIAATIASILDIQNPSACFGQPIQKLIKNK